MKEFLSFFSLRRSRRQLGDSVVPRRWRNAGQPGHAQWAKHAEPSHQDRPFGPDWPRTRSPGQSGRAGRTYWPGWAAPADCRRTSRTAREGAKAFDFKWEALAFADFTYDFRREVLRFLISTCHFTTCFEHLPEKVVILWCVLKALSAKHRNLRQ